MRLQWQIVQDIVLKVEWAEGHINKLIEAWNIFLEKKPYRVDPEDYPEIGERVYRLKYVTPVPSHIKLIAGDAVHGLRSALDHLAYQLVVIGSCGKGPFEDVYFPIGDTPKKCKSRIRRIVKRLRKDAIKELLRLQCYEGGNLQFLWGLNELDITDKHHFLLVAHGWTKHHTMLPSDMARTIEQFLGVVDIAKMPPEFRSRAFMTARTGTKFPPEAGDELLRIPLSEADDNMHFRFEVAFGEPKILKSKPVPETLYQIAGLIRNVIRDFDNKGLLTR